MLNIAAGKRLIACQGIAWKRTLLYSSHTPANPNKQSIRSLYGLSERLASHKNIPRNHKGIQSTRFSNKNGEPARRF
jgi:hypothetical protein